MIDDDFDKLVRSMFERFFGKSFEMFPGETGIQMRIDPANRMNTDANISRELIVDEIDLGDEFLVIVESPISVDSPLASVKGDLLEIRLNDVSSKGVDVNLPFHVDIEKSSVSYQNGVIEARLVKASDGTTKKTEGILKVI
jgi:HSP20 family molecular chaperone IbpA